MPPPWPLTPWWDDALCPAHHGPSAPVSWPSQLMANLRRPCTGLPTSPCYLSNHFLPHGSPPTQCPVFDSQSPQPSCSVFTHGNLCAPHGCTLLPGSKAAQGEGRGQQNFIYLFKIQSCFNLSGDKGEGRRETFISH